MSDKKSTTKDVIMFIKNFEVHVSVKEFNQPLDKKEIRIGIKKDSSKKTTKQIQILIFFFQGVLKEPINLILRSGCLDSLNK